VVSEAGTSVASEPDESLVERMSRGDRAALGRLYERHAPRLRALALYILRDAGEADDVLHDRGILVVPDVICNAGGVTVSYFEWVQDLQNLFWREATINARLKEVMVKSFNDVLETSKKHKVDMRTAAYMVAVGRVAEATLTRGIYP